jgi:YHS domain-containing protein
VNVQPGETQVDPVCGMTVEIGDARADGRALEFSAATYVFCSDGCLAEFLASPETYQESTTDSAER